MYWGIQRRYYEMKQTMTELFEKIFGDAQGVEVYFAPGRVNLIGQHMDYNGGHVLPCTISLGTWGAVRKRADRRLRLYSANFPEAGIVESDLDSLVYDKAAGWTNYVKGVIWAFEGVGIRMTEGMDLVISGNIPIGYGLAASASIEILVGEILRDLYQFDVANRMLARCGQYAEKHFCGINSGILNQLSVAMGRKDQAVFVNTTNLSCEYVPFKPEGVKLVIACTNKKCSLDIPEYAQRRGECAQALVDLEKMTELTNLCELTEEEFEAFKGAIKDPVHAARAHYAVTENQRTIQAKEKLLAGDLAAFGALMNASHAAVRDEFEMTGPELDTLVEAAWKAEGVLGARMTCVGFGGCTVNLVKEEAVENFIEEAGKTYLEKIGYKADFYVVETGNKASKL